MVETRDNSAQITGAPNRFRALMARRPLFLLVFLTFAIAAVYGGVSRDRDEASMPAGRSPALVSACLRNNLAPIYSDLKEIDVCGTRMTQRVTCRRDEGSFMAKNGSLKFSVGSSNAGGNSLIKYSAGLSDQALNAIRNCTEG